MKWLSENFVGEMCHSQQSRSFEGVSASDDAVNVHKIDIKDEFRFSVMRDVIFKNR